MSNLKEENKRLQDELFMSLSELEQQKIVKFKRFFSLPLSLLN